MEGFDELSEAILLCEAADEVEGKGDEYIESDHAAPQVVFHRISWVSHHHLLLIERSEEPDSDVKHEEEVDDGLGDSPRRQNRAGGGVMREMGHAQWDQHRRHQQQPCLKHVPDCPVLVS